MEIACCVWISYLKCTEVWSRQDMGSWTGIQSSYSITIVCNDLNKKYNQFSIQYHTISYQNNNAKVKCAAINNEYNINNKETSYDITNRNDTLQWWITNQFSQDFSHPQNGRQASPDLVDLHDLYVVFLQLHVYVTLSIEKVSSTVCHRGTYSFSFLCCQPIL